MDNLAILLERKKKAESFPDEIRIKYQSEYDAILEELKKYETSTIEDIQCKQSFNMLEPKHLVDSVYSRKITVNEYMEVVRLEEYPEKQLKYMVQFFNQYLLIRYKKANELLSDNVEFNNAEKIVYKNITDLMKEYLTFFEKKGLDTENVLIEGIINVR